MALKNYSLMMAEAYPYLTDYQIDNGTVDTGYDPYSAIPHYDDRVI